MGNRRLNRVGFVREVGEAAVADDEAPLRERLLGVRAVGCREGGLRRLHRAVRVVVDDGMLALGADVRQLQPESPQRLLSARAVGGRDDAARLGRHGRR